MPVWVPFCGLAAAQALVTGRNATVFNPAGVHEKTIDRHGANFDRVNELVKVYTVNGEILNTITDKRGWLAFGTAVGGALIGGPLTTIVGGGLANELRKMPQARGDRTALPAFFLGQYEADNNRFTFDSMNGLEMTRHTVDLYGNAYILTGLFVHMDRRYPEL